MIAVIGNNGIGNNSQTKISLDGTTTNIVDYSQGGPACYLDGAGDYLSTPDHADFNFADADFTIDFHMKLGTVSGNVPLFSQATDSTHYIVLYHNQDDGFRIAYENGGAYTYLLTKTGTPQSINTWYHVALVRYGNVWTVYVNGVLSVTATTAYTWVNYTGTPFIGYVTGASIGTVYATGYIKNFRVTKGRALFTTTFTPPSRTALPSIVASETVLLITPNATPITSRDIATSKAITNNGGAIWTNRPVSVVNNTTFASTFNAPALKTIKNGTATGYMLLSASSAFQISATTLATIDFWIAFNTLETQTAADYIVSNTAETVAIRYDIGAIAAYMGGTDIGYTTTPTLQQWYHIGISTTGTRTELWVDGVKRNSAAQTNAISSTDNIYIGKHKTVNYYMDGHLKNFRWTTGEVLSNGGYTSNNLDLIPTITANTKILLGYGATPTTFKNLVTPTVISTFGAMTQDYFHSSWSKPTIYLDGTNDYLTVPNSTDFDFGTGDFTLDTWVRPSSVAGGLYLCGQTADANNWWELEIGDLNAGKPALAWANGTPYAELLQNGNTTLVANIWYHVAYVRYGSSHKIYVNGKDTAGTFTYGPASTFTQPSSSVFNIGSRGGTHTSSPTYLSNFKVTRRALWTKNFNPPLRHS